jgi:hypothetical protein
MTDIRTCKDCGATKPLGDFAIHRRVDGEPLRRPSCKKCYAAYMRDYFARNPEQKAKDRARTKRYHELHPTLKKETKLRLSYGMTLEEYDAMLAAQNGVCAICNCEDTNIDKRTGKNRALAVDHCHETGAIRGLLCGDCNRAIGMAKESTAILSRMISYLSNRSTPARKAARQWRKHQPRPNRWSRTANPRQYPPRWAQALPRTTPTALRPMTLAWRRRKRRRRHQG